MPLVDDGCRSGSADGSKRRACDARSLFLVGCRQLLAQLGDLVGVVQHVAEQFLELVVAAILLRRSARRWLPSSSLRSGSIWFTPRSGLKSSRLLNSHSQPLLQPSPLRLLSA